jgi:hypothetical protein
MKSELKSKYLRTLQEYVEERLYITDKTDEFQLEFNSNCWHINGSREEIQSLDLDEWKAYIRHLINDRQKQLNASPVQTDLLIYIWHDEMAGQLRFNVISANHPKLPLACNYVEAGLDEIIDPFIKDEYPGIIPFSEVKIVEGTSVLDLSAGSNEEGENAFIAKVYVEKIKKNAYH